MSIRDTTWCTAVDWRALRKRKSILGMYAAGIRKYSRPSLRVSIARVQIDFASWRASRQLGLMKLFCRRLCLVRKCWLSINFLNVYRYFERCVSIALGRRRAWIWREVLYSTYMQVYRPITHTWCPTYRESSNKRCPETSRILLLSNTVSLKLT